VVNKRKMTMKKISKKVRSAVLRLATNKSQCVFFFINNMYT